MIIAIIPARGGSKRIPQKNIRSFCGKPIIQYSIEAAIQSDVFDRVIVSTDSDDIAAIAERCGAEVPFRRPAYLSDEFATTLRVIQHAIAATTADENPVKFACCIYGTAPFVTPTDIKAGFERIKNLSTPHFVLPVTTFPYCIFRSLRMTQSFEGEMFYPKDESTRSQDLPEAWHDAGQFYWAGESTWMQAKGILSAKLIGIPIPRHRVQDIDTPEDWRRAELMFELLSKESDV
jgi:pseudaminic acid cytidylyltransferase